MAGPLSSGDIGGARRATASGGGRLATRASVAKSRSITSQAEAFRRCSLRILAIDTTTRAGSTAVLDDHQVLIELTGDAATTHGERLPAEVARTLAAAGVALDTVDLLAVVAGPGSFTGLRVGIASMQGLAFARGLKIVPVSALEAIARQAQRGLSPARTIAPWVDAHRGEVFAALYAGSPLDERGRRRRRRPPSRPCARYEGLEVSRTDLLRR